LPPTSKADVRGFIEPNHGASVIPKGLSVALVEPQYPVNVGHVARLVKNFGASRLYLVNPKVDMSVAAIYAAHASDVLERARTISFGRLRRDNELLVATTAVRASKGSNIIRRTVRPERVWDIVSAAKTASLVFGRDTTGLTNEEIAKCDVTTAINTGTHYRTLNVGHAVAIMLYLTSSRQGRARALQSRGARDLFADNFYELALAARMPTHKVKTLREVGKRIASSAGLTDGQLNLMAGVFRKATLAQRLRQARDSKT
jgi:TrmH family RNA methyltransferase